jgi:hypothetical protein
MNCQIFFLAVELGRLRRQLQERYVSGYLEVLRSVPAGLIEEEDRVGAGADFCGDLVQMKLCMASVLQKGRTRAAPVPYSGQTAPNR